MTEAFDPVDLEIVRNQLEGVATEMGRTLIRGAYSPNIKERRDASTAIFDPEGRLVAQAEHIPVHLGALPDAVAAVREHGPAPGDVFLLNDPFAGGTHLPDVTLVAPLAPDGDTLGYGAVRAHHADVGGATPGSLPAGARDVYAEGIRVPPVAIRRRGQLREDVLGVLLANVRHPRTRRADLHAQLGAIERGEVRLGELAAEHGRARLAAGFEAVRRYSRRRTTAAIGGLADGTYRAVDALEGDGRTDDPVEIQVAVTVDGDAVHVDFDGTDDQVDGNVNAPPAVAKSAVYFVVRCVTGADIPPNAGCFDPVTVEIPHGSVLHPRPPAAVGGGNVETSQRVADVVLEAFRGAEPTLPAHGQGTMNNLLIGPRGHDETYYETIGGGFGARPDKDGIDGVHVGMTNTRNTPVETLEQAFPLTVLRYGLRPTSGGDGRHRGGLGIERTVRVEVPSAVSILSDRRRRGPPGAAGGAAGATGVNEVGGERVGSKVSLEVAAGTVVRLLTPGGGGFGDPAERDPERRDRDVRDGKVDPETG
ncbi:MAG: hydantoinase B/oxoprolinase family protein [Halobacteriales archaeon]